MCLGTSQACEQLVAGRTKPSIANFYPFVLCIETRVGKPFFFISRDLRILRTCVRVLRSRAAWTTRLRGRGISGDKYDKTHNDNTWLAMLVMNDLTSMDVGQDSWHGACAHLRQRRASRTAARSPSRSVVGLTSVHHRFHKPPAQPSTVPAVSCTKINVFYQSGFLFCFVLLCGLRTWQATCVLRKNLFLQEFDEQAEYCLAKKKKIIYFCLVVHTTSN